MTHADLVQRAERWLRNSRNCSVVLTRGNVCAGEQPDALGWNGQGWSILVECKTSRADFLRDQHKPHRIIGVGNERWFLATPGIVDVADLPDDWGLLECLPAQVRQVHPAARRPESNRPEEIRLLLGEIRHQAIFRAASTALSKSRHP